MSDKIPTVSDPQPYAKDMDFALAWVELASVRCKRLDLERRLKEAEEDPKPVRGVVGATEKTLVKEYTRRLKVIREAEVAVQKELDGRVGRNRRDGPALAIDLMAEEFGLGDLERTTLLMSIVPCLGHTHAEMFNSLSSYGFSGNSLTVEAVWAFMGMDREARIRSRVAFLPTSPLLARDLIATTYFSHPTPDNTPGAVISITSQAFSRLVGLPELAVNTTDGDKDR